MFMERFKWQAKNLFELWSDVICSFLDLWTCLQGLYIGQAHCNTNSGFMWAGVLASKAHCAPGVHKVHG